MPIDLTPFYQSRPQSGKLILMKQIPYFIGDIHGCYPEFLDLEAQILEHAASQQAEALIVSVGDLIDRGPDSAGVLSHFLSGEAAGSHAAIMGNHELMLLQCLADFAPQNFAEGRACFPPLMYTLRDQYERRDGGFGADLDWPAYSQMSLDMWVNQGGRETLQSFGLDSEMPPESWILPVETLQYLCALPILWQDKDVVVTHALITQQELEYLQAIDAPPESIFAKEALRVSIWQALWNRTVPTDRPDQVRQHISGHTPAKQVRYWQDIECVQIDTACVYGRYLSAWCPHFDVHLVAAAEKNYLAAVAKPTPDQSPLTD